MWWSSISQFSQLLQSNFFNIFFGYFLEPSVQMFFKIFKLLSNYSDCFSKHHWTVTWIAKSIMINDAQNLGTKCDRHVLIRTSVACAVGPSATTFSMDFSFQNLVFRNLFEFSVAKITSISISHTFWLQIFSNKFH
jgi:hypothetical protein